MSHNERRVLCGEKAAVDGDGDTVDHGGEAGKEKEDGTDDVIDFAESPQGNLCQHWIPLLRLGPTNLAHCSQHHRRVHRIRSNLRYYC